ncbi:structural protein P5, partial [Pseudomonas sp. MAFF 302046]|nr:structural protein P5 [Pseudomonas morbosilactucae]
TKPGAIHIAAIAKRLGVKANDVIDIKNPATLRAVMVGIIVHENGGNPYPDAVFEEGLRRALK